MSSLKVSHTDVEVFLKFWGGGFCRRDPTLFIYLNMVNGIMALFGRFVGNAIHDICSMILVDIGVQ